MKKLFDYSVFGRGLIPMYYDNDGDGDDGDGDEGGKGGGGGDPPVSAVGDDGTFTENWHEPYGKENTAYLSRFKTFPDLVKSSIETNKMRGKNPKDLVEMPTDKSSDEVWNTFHERRGVPADKNDYKYELSPELTTKLGALDDGKMERVREFAHKDLHMTPGNFTKLLDFYYNEMGTDLDAFDAQMVEKQSASLAEGKLVWDQMFKADSATRSVRANAVLDKYGLDEIKMPDGSLSSIKGELLARNPNLITDPYFLMLQDKVAESMSEDTLKGIVGKVGLSQANVESQIVELRSHAGNKKGDPRYKQIQLDLIDLYKKKTA